jgi:polar amino acid transport system substrate-binding protein
MRTLLLVCLAISIACIGAATAQAQRAAFTTLEWPPYTGADIPEQGASAKVARMAFAAAGIDDFELVFFPWRRTVLTARHDDRFIGYMPEYHARHIEQDFIFSDCMGTSTLGLIENPKRPVEWETLDDLRRYTIGVVTGYVNTTEFDAMANTGELHVDLSVDDAANIRKVAESRIDLAVIDAHVFAYLMKTDSHLAQYKGRVRLDERPLETKCLYLCFRRSPEGRGLADAFNAGLRKIEWRRVQSAYFDEILN